MKYYSELTKTFFDSEEACKNAEAQIEEERKKKEEEKKKLSETRKQRAKEVQDARAEMKKASDKYFELLRDFLADYGTYHYSETTVEPSPFMKFFGDIFES